MGIPAGPSSSGSGGAALDLITLNEAKQGINLDLTITDADSQIAAYVTAVSRRLDDLCGPIVERTVTDEPHNGGRGRIFLRYGPVSSVTTVKEYSGTTLTTLTEESVTSQTTNQFVIDEDTGVLYHRDGGCDSVFAAGRKNVLVTYVPGRFATTGDVDEKFKEAAQIMLSHLWRRTGSRVSANDLLLAPDGASMFSVPSFSVPNAVRELLREDIKSPAVA